MERGWVKLWRKLEDSPVFQNEALLKVFIWCVMKANTEKRHIPLKIGKGTTEVTVQRGQFIFGRNTAGKALNMHPETARKRMAKLARLGVLKIESTKQYSLVTLFLAPQRFVPLPRVSSRRTCTALWPQWVILR